MAKISLIELAKTFLRIGILSFGGPYAHISLFEDELINNKKLLSTQSFEKGIGLCQILPGPISTQLAIYIGLKINGYLGGLISGISFIIPGFVSVLALSFFWQIGSGSKFLTDLIYFNPPIIAGIIFSFSLVLLKKDEHNYEGTAADVVGTAKGFSYGSAFKLEYVLLVPVKGKEIKITFDDWIFKQDERVAINRATMTKFGFKVAELTVVFVKD